jgi:hypothetical protein
MAKIELDKYYTPIDIAKYCIDKTHEVIGTDNITEYLEPSAGNGSFSLLLQNCIAYDIEPEHESIIKHDFLTLDIEYKGGRCIIGNPPFGRCMNLAVQFCDKSFLIADYISFILPISQYNNTSRIYKFDLIHSEILPPTCYSGINVATCLNIYKRPDNNIFNKKIRYSNEHISIYETRRGRKSRNIPEQYDIILCGWGDIGKEVITRGTYAKELFIKINNKERKDVILTLLKNTDWSKLYPMTTTPNLLHWHIYKHIAESLI